MPETGTLGPVLATRVADLDGYQNERYAHGYAADVRHVATVATDRVGAESGEHIAVAYAKGLHKLMAYKDEYEVARLHLDPVEQARRDAEFGPDARVSVLLHPPALRALGMRRKMRLRRTAKPLFRALRALRRLRGTPLDVFGYAHVRKVERELIGEYRQLDLDALNRVRPETVDDVLAIAALPDLVRGYEDIKLANVAEFRRRARAALEELTKKAGTAISHIDS